MSMTIKEAIERIADHMEVHHIGEPPHIYIGEALRMAITALSEKAECRNPPPLTLDELRQMDGEPVWVKEANEWAIVQAVDDDDGNITPFVHGTFGREKCWSSFTWKVSERKLHCYRHKPKEVTT